MMNIDDISDATNSDLVVGRLKNRALSYSGYLLLEVDEYNVNILLLPIFT